MLNLNKTHNKTLERLVTKVRDREIWIRHISCVTKVAHGVRFRAKRKSALEATKFYCELHVLAMEATKFSTL